MCVFVDTYYDRFDRERIQLDGRWRFSRILLVIIRLPTFFRSHLEGRHRMERHLLEERTSLFELHEQKQLLTLILAFDWLRETVTKMN